MKPTRKVRGRRTARRRLPVRPPDKLDSTSAYIASHLLSLRGRERAVSGGEIAELYGTDKRAVQKVVRALRLSGVPVVSSSADPAGYWLADDPREVRELCRDLDRRARKIYAARRALLRSLWLEEAGGQEALMNREEKS